LQEAPHPLLNLCDASHHSLVLPHSKHHSHSTLNFDGSSFLAQESLASFILSVASLDRCSSLCVQQVKCFLVLLAEDLSVPTPENNSSSLLFFELILQLLCEEKRSHVMLEDNGRFFLQLEPASEGSHASEALKLDGSASHLTETLAISEHLESGLDLDRRLTFGEKAIPFSLHRLLCPESALYCHRRFLQRSKPLSLTLASETGLDDNGRSLLLHELLLDLSHSEGSLDCANSLPLEQELCPLLLHPYEASHSDLNLFDASRSLLVLLQSQHSSHSALNQNSSVFLMHESLAPSVHSEASLDFGSSLILCFLE
jgi:hypothetical protein